MESNKLEELQKDMKNEELKDIAKASEKLGPLLDTACSIYERDFVKYFLPIISKEVEPTEDNFTRFTHNVLTLTSSLYVPIQVTRDDDKSKVLFTLPPIMLPIDEASVVSSIDFSAIMNKFQTLEAQSSKAADGYLRTTIKELNKIIKPNDNLKDKYLVDFFKIYYRYNLIDSTTEELGLDSEFGIERSDEYKIATPILVVDGEEEETHKESKKDTDSLEGIIDYD